MLCCSIPWGICQYWDGVQKDTPIWQPHTAGTGVHEQGLKGKCPKQFCVVVFHVYIHATALLSNEQSSKHSTGFFLLLRSPEVPEKPRELAGGLLCEQYESVKPCQTSHCVHSHETNRKSLPRIYAPTRPGEEDNPIHSRHTAHTS